MPQRVAFIDKLIINSPYDEPAEYWSYERIAQVLRHRRPDDTARRGIHRLAGEAGLTTRFKRSDVLVLIEQVEDAMTDFKALIAD